MHRWATLRKNCLTVVVYARYVAAVGFDSVRSPKVTFNNISKHMTLATAEVLLFVIRLLV